MKTKRLWLGRRQSDGRYELGNSVRNFDPQYGWPFRIFVIAFCASDFERLTGIHLEPGEIRKVEEINIVLRDKP